LFVRRECKGYYSRGCENMGRPGKLGKLEGVVNFNLPSYLVPI